MDALEFLSELKRLCNNVDVCPNCPLYCLPCDVSPDCRCKEENEDMVRKS